MVLRDERDMGKKQKKPRNEGYVMWDQLAGECGYRYKNKRIRKILRKKTRIKNKKNINNVIVFKSKQKHIKKEKIKKEKDVCSICYESTKNIKYINCKRGGTQNINFGKYNCCKDKSICGDCRIKCKTCPFCKSHSLTSFKKRFPKKKLPFAIREKGENLAWLRLSRGVYARGWILHPDGRCEHTVYTVD